MALRALRCKGFGVLADGRYDVVVVDVEGDTVDDGAVGDGTVRVELALSSGPHRGEVVAVRGHFPGRNALELLGLPATLTVDDGVPSVTLDG